MRECDLEGWRSIGRPPLGSSTRSVGSAGGAEELFVTGGALDSVGSGSARLATIDVTSLRLTPRGGTLPGTGRRIVGAGVSTCAATELI